MISPDNQLNIPLAGALQVLIGAILRLGARRKMAPLDELHARPAARYTWHAVQAGFDHATCGAYPPSWSTREWFDDRKP